MEGYMKELKSVLLNPRAEDSLVDSINKKFNLNVSVEWNPDIEKFAKKLMSPDDKGGDAIE